METGFAVAAFVSLALNLMLPMEDEAEETESLAGDLVDREEQEAAERDAHYLKKGSDAESAVARAGSVGESAKA